MELRHLRYFVTLADELHFSRAAEKLNIAPPTLTVQIQEIERTLSAKLFARTKRSVALTPAGHVFLAEARNVLTTFAKAQTAGQRAGRGEIGRVEVGYVGSAAYTGVLQEQVRRFRQTRPDVDIHAEEWPMDQLPELISAGQIDVGFIRLPMAPPRGLQLHVLLWDHFCLASSSSHPMASTSNPIDPSQLAGEAFVTPEQIAGTYEVARRGRFSPRVISAPGSLLEVLTQVSLGAGVAIVPSVLRNIVQMPNVVLSPLAGAPIRSEVAAIFRAGERSPVVRNLIEQLVATQPTTI